MSRKMCDVFFDSVGGDLESFHSGSGIRSGFSEDERELTDEIEELKTVALRLMEMASLLVEKAAKLEHGVQQIQSDRSRLANVRPGDLTPQSWAVNK